MNISDFNFDCNNLYDALVKSTDDYIFFSDLLNDIFVFPQDMVDEFGLPSAILKDTINIWGNLVHKNDQAAFFQSFEDLLDGKTDIHNMEYRALNKKGEWVWLRCRGFLIRDEQNKPVLFAGVLKNLENRNKIDGPTGLLNKYEFENALALQVKKDIPCGVLVMGLDDFKHVNDLYNRSFGDDVIRIYGQRIQSILSSRALVYRLDGDEFGVIFENSNEEEISMIYGVIQEEFHHQQEFDGNKFYCTVSAGCTMCPKDSVNAVELFKYATLSLQYSKQNGKNTVSFFNREILIEKAKLLDLTELLRECIEDNCRDFKLFYQPQVNAITQKLIGAEALLRWSCEKYGSVSPGEFIPLLEDSGLMIPIGKWVFRNAVKTCAEWLKEKPDIQISINLSYLQMKDPDFIPFMEQEIINAKVPPDRIIVELTETCIASGSSILLDSFRRIREIGMHIAMDDFGTGYSSLEMLKNAPTDIIKIDRAFVKNICANSFDATFIKFITELCHNINIVVCLEGVELEEEYNVLDGMKLDSIQGYLFGKPQSKEIFEECFLTENARLSQ